MKNILSFIAIIFLLLLSCSKDNDKKVAENGVINHTCIRLSDIPSEWINAAKTSLHIAYGHTSHGSQITDGMSGLVDFKGQTYAWNNGGTGGALDLHDYAMSGHLDGTGLTGNLHIRNEQIRTYCKNHKKFLFDFADIESYNPDGDYFGDKIPNDACDYDSNNDGTRDANWAVEWQNSHTEGVEWYNCGSAHSQPLNANMKAYAAWHLWSRIAGWEGD